MSTFAALAGPRGSSFRKAAQSGYTKQGTESRNMREQINRSNEGSFKKIATGNVSRLDSMQQSKLASVD